MFQARWKNYVNVTIREKPRTTVVISPGANGKCDMKREHVWTANCFQSKYQKHTLRLRAMRMRPWLVMRRSGVLPRSCSSLSMASASMRRLCQLISLNVRTCRTPETVTMRHQHRISYEIETCLLIFMFF